MNHITQTHPNEMALEVIGNSSVSPIVPPTMATATTFRPGISSITLATSKDTRDHKTIMDLAVAAASPEGLPLALLPLYKILHGVVLKKSKYDITSVTTKIVIAGGALLSIRLLWTYIKPPIINSFTSSYTVPNNSQVFSALEKWLAENVGGVGKRHLKLSGVPEGKGSRVIKQEGNQPLPIEPGLKSGWFWFEGQPLFFKYIKLEGAASIPKEEAMVQLLRATQQGIYGRDPDSDSGASKGNPNEAIVISTLGFSSTVIQKLLVKVSTPKEDLVKYTNIHTLCIGTASMTWQRQCKPVRPLSTIDLDEEIKTTLLKDIDTYTSPHRSQWYANRGIPYRRGLLFFGPPGTGKTSTSTAIAGKLGTQLYISSMNELQNEAQLKFVFATPKKGDVLLLEDIDSAGIVRENMKTGTGKKQKNAGVSLSGLLNAIDGACGPEGILLIMTSNDPESLDAALVRPGRIDRQIYFGEVSQAVAERVFLRMYQDDESLKNDEDDAVDPHVKALAREFASRIPDHKLTPAEVQTFLTLHEKPDDAVREVVKWVEEKLAAKAAGKNIVGQKSDHLPKEEKSSEERNSEEECQDDSDAESGSGLDPDLVLQLSLKSHHRATQAGGLLSECP